MPSTSSTDTAYTMPSAEQLLAMEHRVAALAPSTRTNSKGKPTGYKHGLWKGLYVFVTPQGVKSFRFPYRAPGPDGQTREQLHTLQPYHPGTFNVGQAIAEHARLREALAAPTGAARIRERRASAKQGSVQTFRTAARDWLESRSTRVTTKTGDQHESLIARYCKPLLDERLGDITPPMCIRACQVPAGEGKHNAARNVARLIRDVYTRAINVGPYSGGNPAANTLKEFPKRRPRNYAALRVPSMAQFFSDVAYFEERRIIREQTAIAIELQMHLFVRPSILAVARWDWLDMKHPCGPTMLVPPFTVGTKQLTTARNAEREGADYVPFHIPLSKPALALIERLRVIAKGSHYLLPKRGSADAPMSRNGLRVTVQNVLGWDGKIKDKSSMYYRPRITMHGMRSLFSSGMRDEAVRNAHGWAPYSLAESEAIELQMDHKVKIAEANAAVMQAYYRGEDDSHRTLRLAERHTIMQRWSAVLDEQKRAAPVRTLAPNPARKTLAQHAKPASAKAPRAARGNRLDARV